MKEQIAIQELLRRKLTEARSTNPSYSLRAFSRKLAMGSSAVSEILNGKRMISKKMAQKIVTRLALEPQEAHLILSRFNSTQKRRKRLDPFSLDALSASQQRKVVQLRADEFNAISDWYHFAILSLLETQEAKSEPQWLAKRLGISLVQATQALERLERLNLIIRDGETIRLTGNSLTTTDHVSNLALRKSHAQNLELAKKSLETDGIDQRDFTAITMAVNTARLPEVKSFIRKFRDQIAEYLEADPKDEVYKLCIQLIPLSQGGK